MGRAPWTQPALYKVGSEWARRCLIDDDSLFTPGRSIWTAEAADEVSQRVAASDPDAGDFMARLQKQVGDLSDEVIQFAAELNYVQLLPISDIGQATKIKQLQTILGWMTSPVGLPDDLTGPLDGGVAHYGPGLAQRAAYMQYSLRIVAGVKAVDRSDRERVLSDPWLLREFVDGTSPTTLMQRQATLHLLFPDTFDYALVAGDKQRIRVAFKAIPEVSAAADDDRALLALRAKLEPALDAHLNLYQPWFMKIWKDKEGQAEWAPVLHWAARLLEWDGFNGAERDYKLAVAGRIAAAREAVLASRDDWLPLLRTGLGNPNNLSSWQWENQPLLRWCEENPEAGQAFLRALWAPDAELDARWESAVKLIPSEVLRGAALVTMLSVLTMAVDATRYPPFRTGIVQSFRKRLGYDIDGMPPDIEAAPSTPAALARLLGTTPSTVRDYLRQAFPRESDEAGEAWDLTPEHVHAAVEHFTESGDSPVDSYQAFLHLMDVFRVRLLAKGVETADRLEAQGLMWSLEKGDAPTTWSAEEQRAFTDFQAARASSVTTVSATTAARAWLVRGANVNGENMISRWLDEGFMSIGWPEMGPLPQGMDMGELYEALKRAYPELALGAWRTWTGILYSFLSRMKVGDLVLTVDGDAIYVGTITGELYEDEGGPPEALRRRSIEWRNPTSPLSRAAAARLSQDLKSRLRVPLTISDLTPELTAIRKLLDGESVVTPALDVPDVTEDAAKELHIPRTWLQSEVVDLLLAKKQVVFYGPPGTGKTFVAKRLADDLVRRGGEALLVQFHPSYGYEDFFEGFRPVPSAEGVGVSYELTPGPLRRMAGLAADDPAHPYVLVIDEINRGNIPKIFGELLFLLEYRSEQIPLQYSPDSPFGLPPNLFIIGTMNTADRSIALVDAALRRRFYFVEFTPRRPPVDTVLRSWLAQNGHPSEAADAMDALNARLAQEELCIGPSYFINGDGSAPDLERIWKYAILPLLEEYFYGAAVGIEAEYSLKALLNGGPSGEPSGEPEESPER